MTNEEAIKLIQGIEEDGRNVTSEHVEALHFAIKSLKANDRLLSLSNQVEEENGQLHIHIADVRRILEGDV